MNKATKFGIVALLLISLVGSAFAFEGYRNQEVKEALEAGDYDSWKEAKVAGLTEERFEQARERYTEMQEKRAEKEALMDEICETEEIPDDIPEKIAEHLEENLDAVCQLHKARQDGATKEEIKELAEELGLEKPNRAGRQGKGMMRNKNRQGSNQLPQE